MLHQLPVLAQIETNVVMIGAGIVIALFGIFVVIIGLMYGAIWFQAVMWLVLRYRRMVFSQPTWPTKEPIRYLSFMWCR